MNLAFNINILAFKGLGATIASLLRNCSDTKRLSLWFLCAGLSSYHKDQINKLLKSEQFQGSVQFIDFDAVGIFGHLKSLHNDWTPYGRLLLADLVTTDTVLYIDSDLAVELDVLEIEDFDFKGSALAAVEAGQIKNCYENVFFTKLLGMLPSAPTFNSGVVYFNLKEWRAKGLQQKCLNFGSKYPAELLSADQTILNALFAGSFSNLPASFNCSWFSYSTRPTVAEKMIIHFVGSPKPWDPFGWLIHNGYSCWKKYSNSEWNKAFGGYTLLDYKRTWHLRRSYLRDIRLKFNNFKTKRLPGV